jgi:hypothetical protein
LTAIVCELCLNGRGVLIEVVEEPLPISTGTCNFLCKPCFVEARGSHKPVVQAGVKALII